MERAADLNGASSLWRSVLAQAVRDLYCGETRHRLDTIKWLKSTDFETVCDLACVEPTGMRSQLIDLLSLPDILARKYGKLLRDKMMEGIRRAD